MRQIIYWALALIVTLASAYYQRVSGPTYPETGKSDGISYKFDRSHSGFSPQDVEIKLNYKNEEAFLFWKRYKTQDEWNVEKMRIEENNAIAQLPPQPPAGKLEYYVLVSNGIDKRKLPADHNVVTRFKGEVPALILIPHIILIFLAMLLSVRTGIEAVVKGRSLKNLTLLTLGALIFGGMIFGPITQLYAFGELWTGFPFGYDLTDNKTLIALIGWLIATYAVMKERRSRLWVLFAALLMLIIFLIPHSMFGSELDYSKLDQSIQSSR